MIEIKNLDEVQEKINAWCLEAEKVADETLRGVVSYAFTHMLQHGPQYSGDYVANLRLSIGSPDTSFDPYVVNQRDADTHKLSRVFQQGDVAAQQLAAARANQVVGNIRVGDTVFISSSAAHDKPYAKLSEDNVISFRAENWSKGATMTNAALMTATRFAKIAVGDVVSLRSLRILSEVGV